MKYDNSLHELQDIAEAVKKKEASSDRMRGPKEKNGKGKYKETTLTQLYLMQIASDFPPFTLAAASAVAAPLLRFLFFPVSCVLRMMLPPFVEKGKTHMVQEQVFSVDFLFKLKHNI